ncbi:MAG: hypothetical protein HDR05_07345 [Lachnospiraceae bacterium]|nr:hypothetical protein [Lachnospiraceae bacterium]
MRFYEYITSLNRNFDGVTVIGILGSIASILGLIPLFKKIRLQKKLKCILLNEAKITSGFSVYKGLEITYDNKKIERFTITKIMFWNDSKSTIYQKDVDGEHPFEAIVNGGKILRYKIEAGDKSENKISVNIVNENTVKIAFDFLHYLEGGIIEIYHTGAEDSVSVPKEIDGGRINAIVSQQKKTKVGRLIRKVIFGVIVIVITVLFILYSIGIIKDMIIMGGMLAIILFIAIYLILSDRKRERFIPTNCKAE